MLAPLSPAVHVNANETQATNKVERSWDHNRKVDLLRGVLVNLCWIPEDLGDGPVCIFLKNDALVRSQGVEKPSTRKQFIFDLLKFVNEFLVPTSS